jgi:hypothetical protein
MTHGTASGKWAVPGTWTRLDVGGSGRTRMQFTREANICLTIDATQR